MNKIHGKASAMVKIEGKQVRAASTTVKKASVVNMGSSQGGAGGPYDVYIGRGGKWGNPFPEKQYGRYGCIVEYEKYLKKSPLINDLAELKGKTLGCYCAPKACHGHVLADLVNKELRTDKAAGKTMAFSGSRDARGAMYGQSGVSVNRALDAGYRAAVGGATGVDTYVVGQAISGGYADKLDIYLPKNIADQPPEYRSLYEIARDKGANIIECAGENADYNKALKQAARNMAEKADALVAIRNNNSPGTGEVIKAIAEKGKPVMQFEFKNGLFRIATRINSMLLPVAILQAMADYEDFKKELIRIDALRKKLSEKTATQKEIKELLDAGFSKEELQKIHDGGWTKLDDEQIEKVRPYTTKHSYAGYGNPYHDETGRFCSECESVA